MHRGQGCNRASSSDYWKELADGKSKTVLLSADDVARASFGTRFGAFWFRSVAGNS